jgi:hypothetical protein
MHRVGLEPATPVCQQNAVNICMVKWRYNPTVLTLILDGGESSASQCGRVIPGNKAPGTH